jgi:hypothetical protein
MLIVSLNKHFLYCASFATLVGYMLSLPVHADTNGLEPSSIWYPKVAPIFQNSCSQCHVAKENGRKGMAARKLDLTDYLSTKKLTLSGTELAMIEKVLQSGKMPPKAYLWMHPECKVSEPDKAMILNWIKAEKTQ